MFEKIISISVISLMLLSGCEGDQKSEVPNAPDTGTAIEIPDAPPPVLKRWKWRGKFDTWVDLVVENDKRLPECTSGWFNSALDDEFVVWKCEKYKHRDINKQGQLAIHTRNGKVFMITTSVEFDDPEKFESKKQILVDMNQKQAVAVPKKLTKITSHMWDYKKFISLLSAGENAFSVIYLKSKDDGDVLLELLKRQKSMSRMKKRYRIGDFDYVVTGFEKRRTVGRGTERWEAKQTTDFVVINYKIRNLSRTLQQDDPAKVVLIGGQTRLEPNERAERAFFGADRTGKYLSQLDFRKDRQRAHVFEVERKDMQRPLIFVISQGDQKLVYKLDLRENQ